MLQVAQCIGHVEGQVEGQREAHNHVGDGQRQDEHVGDDAAQLPAVAQRQNGQSIAAEDGQDQQAVDNPPDNDIRLNGVHSIAGRIVSGDGSH